MLKLHNSLPFGAWGAKVTLTLGSALLALSPASAHVTVNPKEAPAGSYAKLTLRVPHGCEGSPTIRLRVQIPEGATSVKPMVHPLWEIETVKKPLATPYESHGRMITETVAEVIWSGGVLPDEFMDEFSISLKLPDRPGETIPIPVVQECEKGISRWIQVAQPGEDPHDLPEPAPLLKLTSGSESHGHSHGHGHPTP
ncbi:YcnI family protein [Synechococcus sp. Nb3U1]|uniref:YcnI family copper-binding membrane protein n=1 Tax=Synechococcus sp. Nb3U1 TaxID=1914529 RepID=UPI001F33BCB0|nr:YcnI family protein [Synechococcus sp. Nb3U1]MCF2972084.1 YcnI family protein [Synechococcus sp. Nb3U1]